MNARDKILEAADDIFGKVGFDAATTREIAERSGVNKALIHYHFKSKDGLLGSLLERYYEKLGETLKTELGQPGTLRARMLGLVDTYLDFLRDNQNFSRIVQREASGGRHMERIQGLMTPMFQLGAEAVKAAYPATRSGDLAAEQILVSFYGVIVTYFTYSGVLKHLLGTDPLSDDAFEARRGHVRRLLDILLDAVNGNAEREDSQ